MRILVAIDGEVSANTAMDYLRRSKFAKDSDFKLVHVIQPSFVEGPVAGYPAYMADLQQIEREQAQELLDSIAGQLADELAHKVEAQVHFGPCATVVAEEATAWHADLIIAATHARRGFGRFWFGSMAQQIAATAPCSVVVLKIPHEEKTAA